MVPDFHKIRNLKRSTLAKVGMHSITFISSVWSLTSLISFFLWFLLFMFENNIFAFLNLFLDLPAENIIISVDKSVYNFQHLFLFFSMNSILWKMELNWWKAAFNFNIPIFCVSWPNFYTVKNLRTDSLKRNLNIIVVIYRLDSVKFQNFTF